MNCALEVIDSVLQTFASEQIDLIPSGYPSNLHYSILVYRFIQQISSWDSRLGNVDEEWKSYQH